MPSKQPPFQRVSSKQEGMADETGTIQIRIFLREGVNQKKGNVSKSITVKNAKVTEVFKILDKALFG